MMRLVMQYRHRMLGPWVQLFRFRPAIPLLMVTVLVCLGGCSEDKSTVSQANSKQESKHGLPGSDGVPIVLRPQNSTTIRVEHLSGTSEVPTHPKKVCALAFIDELLAIGVRPLAASSSATGFPDYLRSQLDEVVPIYQMMGTMMPDFERIALLQPDVIITSNVDPQTYAQLSKIAPVVDLMRSSWDDQQRILDIGLLLGKAQEARAVLAAYQAKVVAAKQVLNEKVRERPVAFFRVFGRQMYIHGHTRGGLLLYDELGLTPPALINDSPRGYMLSPEALLQLDAEYLFVAAEKNLGARRSWECLLNHPAWQRVPAVKLRNVYPIRAQQQWLVPGIQGKSRMIDEIVSALAPESTASIQQAANEAYEANRP